VTDLLQDAAGLVLAGDGELLGVLHHLGCLPLGLSSLNVISESYN
jgi:hypothetical protein